MRFKEIKDLNNNFALFNSFNEFYDYLKSLSENKKLSVKRNSDRITLILYVVVSLNYNEIQINLFPGKKDVDLNIEEIWQAITNMEDEINFLKKENEKLKKEVDFLKKENKELRSTTKEKSKETVTSNEDTYNIDMTNLIKEDERSLLCKEIENRMCKKIKRLKKLYQATVDGGDPSIFHSKCDNILNTLIVIHSQDQKRFGGFTPIPWKSDKKGVYANDDYKKTFIFSLDSKKILSLNDTEHATFHRSSCGPCFGCGWDIGIEGDPIKENKLFVFRKSFDYTEQYTPISEYSYYNKGKALEYEVFKVIFDK